jgi:RNA polymerase sporulation-specific sigma factor
MANFDNQSQEEIDSRRQIILKYIELVDIVKNSKNKDKIDLAFNEILILMKDKINRITYKFNIPGLSKRDIHQEALVALKFKAIKDYDKLKSNIGDLSPFDNFAILCIRRHLSTLFKSSFRSKDAVLNTSTSLDRGQDKKNNTDINLNEVLTSKTCKKNIDALSRMDNKEYIKKIFSELMNSMSDFEKQVFLLYSQKQSYEVMCEKIYDTKPKRSHIKSIDNALMRIKSKRQQIYKENNPD